MKYTIYVELFRPLMGLVIGGFVGFFGMQRGFEVLDFVLQRQGADGLALQAPAYQVFVSPLCAYIGCDAFLGPRLKKVYEGTHRILVVGVSAILGCVIGGVGSWYVFELLHLIMGGSAWSSDSALVAIFIFFVCLLSIFAGGRLGIYIGNGAKMPDFGRDGSARKSVGSARKSVTIWGAALATGFGGVLMAFGLSGHVFYVPAAFFSFGYVGGKLVETNSHRVPLIAILGSILGLWIASALSVDTFFGFVAGNLIVIMPSAISSNFIAPSDTKQCDSTDAVKQLSTAEEKNGSE